MRTLHFVYAGDPLNDAAIQTPVSITNHIYRALEHDFNIRYYDWTSKEMPEVGPDDIVLGHPNLGEDTVIQRIFRECHPAAKYLIFPFHTAMPEINWPFDPLVQACDKVFSITGDYWYQTIGQTQFAHWAKKMTQLNNAIDVSRFPYLRHTFHEPGQRTLFYVGRDGVEKGSAQLAELARRSGMKLYYAGSINRDLFQGVDLEYLGFINVAEMAPFITEHCDFFVNMSVSDANPTTILEMAAIGLPVLATKESGYGGDVVSCHLSLRDMDYNLALLRDLQQSDCSCFLKWANGAREQVEKKYTWNNFLAPILAEMEQWK
jgi:glycosyltransferase involved in cell wall biosynthesis